MAELDMSVEDPGGEIERLLASIEPSLEWLKRTKSDEVARPARELQQILDEIRGELRGT